MLVQPVLLGGGNFSNAYGYLPNMNGADVDSDASDRVLLVRMSQGDRAALGALYHGYHGRLCRFLSRLTRRADVIEEVTNDTFWIIWQKAGEFRGESRVSTWIMGIAYRCGLKALRRRGAEAVEAGLDTDESTLASHPDEDRELRDWLSKGLDRLSADQRVVIELVYGVGHSMEDVAAIMRCPLGTVKARLFHARVKLRNVLPGLAGEPAAYKVRAS